MTLQASTRWGGDESEPTVDRMRAVLAKLDADDTEHESVSFTHKSEWCLSVYPGGLLVRETWRLSSLDT